MINQRYKINKQIGEGRSRVFLCDDIENTGTQFAIKILNPEVSNEEKLNFRNEFFILKKLEHPNIIRAEEFGTVLISENELVEEGSLYITSEYFPSTELLKTRPINKEKFVREITRQICGTLYYLHQSNYIYYDLKPENILVNSEGEIPKIKLIDLGLSQYSPPVVAEIVKGTANYIAPELLKKQPHDFRVDFYSFGILLYLIVYDRFPFSSENELEIYKAHIEEDFEFPDSQFFSKEFVEALKSLLKKIPDERPENALAILDHLNIAIDESLCKDFIPAKIFSGREDAINILNTYINDSSSSEIIVIKGFENSGKSSLLNHFHELKINSVLFEDLKGKSGTSLIKYVIKKLFYSEYVFSRLEKNYIQEIYSIFKNAEGFSPEKLFRIISKLSERTNFLILIDDYNLLDDFSIEVFNSIMPVFQINGIKVVITETSEADYRSVELNNIREFSLGSFTDIQLTDFITKAFHDSFPGNKLINLILSYSDLLPGNVISFIKDIILLGVMEFDKNGVSFSENPQELEILEQSHEQIYDRRLVGVGKAELFTIKLISCLDLSPDYRVLQKLLNVSTKEFTKIISNLQTNNLLQRYTVNNTVQINSEGLKKHIYDLLENKPKWHSQIAKKLSEEFPDYNPTELARQFELAGQFDDSYRVYIAQIEQAEKNSAYSFVRKILFHLLGLPLEDEIITFLQMKLGEINYKLSDYNNAVNTIKKIKLKNLSEEAREKINFIRASSLVGAGEYKEGRDFLESLINTVDEPIKKDRILTEMAYAEFELGQYAEAVEKASAIVSNSSSNNELTGRCYNLLGMNEIYNTNDLNEALKWFNHAKSSYEKAKLPRRLAGMEVNLGNIYNILGQFDEATRHWESASELNQSIGNLDQEGLLLLNMGIFYFERRQLEQSLEFYNQALKIFLSLGNFQNQGLALLNLGESYLFLCEYQKACSSLNEALSIFHKRKLPEDEVETLFLLGKLFFKLGISKEIFQIIEKSKKIIEKNNLSSKHTVNLKLLLVYDQFLVKETVELNELEKIIVGYKNLEDRTNYSEATFFKIKILISREEFQLALTTLEHVEFIEFCQQNIIFEAERQYFLGILSRLVGSDKLLPAHQYFESAYDLIKEESITEITFKVLFSLAEYYNQRGNYQKSKLYFSYTGELIQFITESIETPRLRNAFKESKDIHLILTKLQNQEVS